jgi:formate dehydrogenase maturation protein FdhE
MEVLKCTKCKSINKIFYTKTPTGMIKASCEICKSYIKFVSKKTYEEEQKKIKYYNILKKDHK